MAFKMEIKTDGAAFCDAFTGEPDRTSEAMEIRRILNRVIEKLELGYTDGSLMDINGNKVGEWKMD